MGAKAWALRCVEASRVIVATAARRRPETAIVECKVSRKWARCVVFDLPVVRRPSFSVYCSSAICSLFLSVSCSCPRQPLNDGRTNHCQLLSCRPLQSDCRIGDEVMEHPTEAPARSPTHPDPHGPLANVPSPFRRHRCQLHQRRVEVCALGLLHV